MSLIEEHVHETLGRIIIKEEKGETRSTFFDRALVMKILAFLSPSMLLLLWEIFARLGFIDVRLFSSPLNIFRTMIPMLYSGELIYHTQLVRSEYC